MIVDLIWIVLASVAVGGAIGTVFSRNPIASLLFLVLTFASLAGIYVMLEAHFIAAVQVIVYTGAIMVLFLFVIMLLNLGHEYRPDFRNFAWSVAGFVAAGLVGFAIWRMIAGAEIADQGGAAVIDASLKQHNAVGAIAFPLFREYLVAFELTSILLLVAIVGAVLLAKRRV